MPRFGSEMPGKPARIFLSQYPEGNESGMGRHRNDFVVYCAVTLVLTDDANDGCFFTASPAGVRYPVAFRAGWAVAIRPDTWHGVEDVLRTTDRTSITFFF